MLLVELFLRLCLDPLGETTTDTLLDRRLELPDEVAGGGFSIFELGDANSLRLCSHDSDLTLSDSAEVLTSSRAASSL